MVQVLNNRFCRLAWTIGFLPLLATLPACSSQPTPGTPSSSHALPQPHAGTLRLRQVDIFANGLGFFQFQGLVDNDSRQTLRFNPDQIKGVLRSLVFQDMGGGTIGGVVFPTHPKKAGGVRVMLGRGSSLRQLLEQLRGTPVALYLKGRGGRPLAGKIISVVRQSGSRGSGLVVRADRSGHGARWTINLFTHHGLQSIGLFDVQFIRIKDRRVRTAFQRALANLATPSRRHASTVSRQLTLLFNSHGKRWVRFGYLLTAPAWKMSYRLILPAAPKSVAKDPVLQALATVANHSNTNWNGVRLHLLGGQPVSLIPPATQTQASSGLANQGNLFVSGGAVNGMVVYRAPAQPFNPLEGVQALAASGKTHPAFDYAVSQVTLPRGQSVMLPVLAAPIKGRSVDLFDIGSNSIHPFTAIQLTNTSGKYLPSGRMAVYRAGTFAGAARLPVFPPKAEHLIAYAVDQAVLVHTLSVKSHRVRISARLVAGLLYVTSQHRTQLSYRLTNVSPESKTLLLRQAIVPGNHFQRSNCPRGTFHGFNVFTAALARGGNRTARILEYSIRVSETDLASLSQHGLNALAAKRYLPTAIRTAIGHALTLRRAWTQAQNRSDTVQAAIDKVNEMESHLRANLAIIKKVSPVYTTMAGELNTQELRYQKLQKTLQLRQNAVAAASKAFENNLQSMSIGPLSILH
ncbi:MAG: hypothetical protein HKL95_03760 [Phycisphaerae bacterium]|nr:hypothetical protein [Phycisphaerae bacterium]